MILFKRIPDQLQEVMMEDILCYELRGVVPLSPLSIEEKIKRGNYSMYKSLASKRGGSKGCSFKCEVLSPKSSQNFRFYF